MLKHSFTLFKVSMKCTLPVILLVFLWVSSANAVIPAEIMPSGGGEFSGPKDHISDKQRQTINRNLRISRQALRANQKLDEAFSSVPVKFNWPLKASSKLDFEDYHGISNFVDQNPNSPNQIQDYFCGSRTYDTSSGYNHRGIDYFTFPFSWYLMRNRPVHIVAAAPGTIIYKEDGNQDSSCSFNETQWNAVYVEHADGSISWYGHMKKGSTTPKAVGETVVAGEYLGIVGSSGNSTGPHLHFETYQPDNSGGYNLIDPYAGTCNTFNTESWWNSQRPYRDSTINTLLTHSAPPSFNTCPQSETTNIKLAFNSSDTVYFASYFHDEVASMTTSFRIIEPNNNVWKSWSKVSTTTYNASWWYWSFQLPTTATEGTWRFEADLNGKTTVHTFTVDVAESMCLPIRSQNGKATVVCL